MDAVTLKSLQTPLKRAYRDDPAKARVVMNAQGHMDLESITCHISNDGGGIVAGLHEAAGGTGDHACSGDLLLESLIACSGVTFGAVATALEVPIDTATVTAKGEMDFRGTLGIDREVPVGLTAINLSFAIKSAASDAQLAKLIQLTERYCVVLKTLACPVSCQWNRV